MFAALKKHVAENDQAYPFAAEVLAAECIDDLDEPTVDKAVHEFEWLLRHHDRRVRNEARLFLESVLCA